MKLKRVVALAGVIILAGMYLLTLIFAVTDHPLKSSLLTASLYCTVVIPVLIYVFMLVTKRFHRRDEQQ